MKKREVVALLSSVALSTTLAACGNQSEMLQMLKNGDQIEIEVAMPEHMQAEQGTEQAAQWVELGKLDTNTIIRNDWDSIMLITKTADGKNGIIYVTEDGKCTQNNTLYVALHNREFQKMFESQDSMDKLAQSVFEQYADLDASIEKSDINIAVWVGVNGYFNLIPDNEVNMANANSPITRGESLALVYRANNAVQELTPDEVFAQAVGDSTFNIYAQNIQSNGYLTTEQGALNRTNYNGNVSRAEFIYLLVNTYYADELASVDVKGVNLSDAKDGGDIAGKQKFDTSLDYWKSYELNYALSNPDGGLPTELYRALVVANRHGLVGSETRWDEAITKAEAIEMLCQAIMHDGKEVFNYKLGEVSGYEAPEDEVETGIDATGTAEFETSDDYLTYNGTPWVIVENGHYAVNPELFEINKDVTIMHGENEETLAENWNESWDYMKDWTESDFLIGRDQAVLQYVYKNFDENGIYIGATTIDDAGTHDIVESETPSHEVTVDEITDEEVQSVIDECGFNIPANKFKDFKKDYVKYLNGQITWDDVFNTWYTQQPSTPTCGSNCPSNCGSNCSSDCGGNCPSNNPCPSDCGSNTGDGNCGGYCPTDGQLCIMNSSCDTCNGFQYY